MPQQIKMNLLAQSKIPFRPMNNANNPKFLPNNTSLNGPMITRVGNHGFGHNPGCSSCGRKG